MESMIKMYVTAEKIAKRIWTFVFYTKIRVFYTNETNIGSGIFTIYKIGCI